MVQPIESFGSLASRMIMLYELFEKIIFSQREKKSRGNSVDF